MCGICGVYRPEASAESNLSLVTQMAESLAHRGPDGQGTFVEKAVALGHRRLSIIDIGGGDQPIYNEDKSICIVFNGEIYNYRELREDLIERGHKFTTHSDTEVIVHLYEERGEKCVEDMNGMFAFAIWDSNLQKLFISRDRLGEKPLYYHYQNGSLVFGSELKALLVNTKGSPELDLEVLETYLAYSYVPEPLCIFKGIKKLPAGHSLVLCNGNLAIEQYWNVAFPAQPDQRSESELTSELESLIRNSVKLRLRSDVPVGAFLSGGIDSSLMVAIAAEEADQQLTTFSVGFTEQDYDELKFAKLVADRYNTDHHEIFVKEVDFDLFPKLVAHFDEPFADPSAIPTYYVTREAARQLKVCLSGDAGDELFCGYSRYNFETLESGLDLIPASVRKMVFDGVAGVLPNSFRGKGRLRRIAASGAQRWQRMVGPFDYFERLEMYREEYKYLANDNCDLFVPYFADRNLNEVSRRMFADQKTYLPDDILVKVDRNSMWHGLEVRVPLLDHRIVEFANSLPLSMKTRDGEQKYIIKKILEGKVPGEIMTRPKKGFGLPLKHWLKDSLQDFAQDLLNSRDTKIHQYLDKQFIGRLIKEHTEGSRDLSKRIWTLLWLEQWCRQHSL